MAAALGHHWLVDLFGCERMPDEASKLQETMEEAARKIGATIVCSTFHAFAPHGLSGVVVIAESHLAVHTWPEFGTACIDLFTCSESMDAHPGIELLREAFGARDLRIREIPRGVRS